MPTYEYQCLKCGEKLDVFQSIKASPLRRTECAACGAVRPVRRLVSAGGAILFKGSGFYQTDYRSESYKKAAKVETSTADSSTASSSTASSSTASSSTASSSTSSRDGKATASAGESKPTQKSSSPKTTAVA